MKAKKLAELSMLTAVALIIFIVELRLPDLTPIQGVKLGLANIITIYAVYKYTARVSAHFSAAISHAYSTALQGHLPA